LYWLRLSTFIKDNDDDDDDDYCISSYIMSSLFVQVEVTR